MTAREWPATTRETPNSAGSNDGRARRRLLWLTPVPMEGAGSRFRIYQHLPGLESAGISCDVRPFLHPAFFRIVYERGRLLPKVTHFLAASLRRLGEMLAMGHYDGLVVYRESFPFGWAIIEHMAKRRGLRLIYDFDDAVYLRDEVSVNPMVRRLRVPERVRNVVRDSDLVSCGSRYLAEWCRPFTGRAVVLPTCVDTRVFSPRSPKESAGGEITVAWVGTHSTSMYLNVLEEPLRRISGKCPVLFDIIGAGVPRNWPGVRIRNRAWHLAEEVDYFRRADVGVYPLRDDEWSRGKCGFKAIQFMSVGVPVVASPVGANLELIRDGINGFFAANAAEWEEKIVLLASDPDLRRRMGEAARQTIEERYSLQIVGPKLVAAFRVVLGM